jgi:hypothetical protein
MKKEQMEKIISYCDKQLSKKELWNWVCDYLTEEMYWDLEDGEISPTDKQIEEVKNVFNKIIKK